MQFLTLNRSSRGKARASKLAIALASATFAFVSVSALETPAFAKKEKKEEAAKPNYSKGFIEAYKPVEALTKANPKDNAAIIAALPAMDAAIETDDDRFIAGNMTYITGRDTKDRALERKGVGMMLQSGKVPDDAKGSYNMLAGQLAYQDKDWDPARTYILAAIDAGYTENDPQAIVAETYFNQEKPVEGLKYLGGVINKKVAAGEKVDESWLKRGVAIAYKADLPDASASFANMLVKYYPTPTSWGDAIAIQRNFFNYDSQQLLDLMRLADASKSMRNERDYVDYIDSADARRLPAEVNRVINEGLAAGLLNTKDVFISEAQGIAKGRLAGDKADLAGLESDAVKPTSNAVTATAAGDAFLSYQDYATADKMYTNALTKAGVDMPRVLNRLAIAQIGEGKYDEAKVNLVKVDGPRKQIANLWIIYANQQAASSSAPVSEETQPTQ